MLTVSNGGRDPLSGVTPRLAVTSGTAYASAPQGPVPPLLATLAPGANTAFTWTLSLTAAGRVEVRAEVTGTLTGQGILVRATAGRDVTPRGFAQLLASLAPDPVFVSRGQWFRVLVTVSNSGSVPAAGVTPQLAPTAGAQLVTLVRGPVPARLPVLEPGSSSRFVFTWSANGSGTVEFTTTVTARIELHGPGATSRSLAAFASSAHALLTRVRATAGEAEDLLSYVLTPAEKPRVNEKAWISFEDPRDLDWSTDGYVRLASSTRFAASRQAGACATFTVPASFTESVTGGETFQPAMRLLFPPRGTERPLAPRDWTPYTSFRATLLLEAPKPVPLLVRIADVRGREYRAMRTLVPETATVLEIPIDALRAADVDAADLGLLEIALDTTGLTEPPRLQLAALRFGVPPPPPAPWERMLPVSRTRSGTRAPAPAAPKAKAAP